VPVSSTNDELYRTFGVDFQRIRERSYNLWHEPLIAPAFTHQSLWASPIARIKRRDPSDSFGRDCGANVCQQLLVDGGKSRHAHADFSITHKGSKRATPNYNARRVSQPMRIELRAILKAQGFDL
jgi:hypothetical protein